MIHLVTDSTANLPQEIKEKFDVHTVSLKLIAGDRTYDEEGGMTQEAFFKLLDSVSTTPTTSQPSSGEFIAVYQKLTANPDDQVISIHISEGLSGTVPNARIAADEVAPGRITVVDSRTTSVGLLLMVVAAGEAIAAGKSAPEIVALLEQMIAQCATVFTVDSLEYLHKGGRINTASRLLGTLLNIKPILHLSGGKIEPLDKARSSKRAIQRAVDELVRRFGDRPVHAAVTHILAYDEAVKFAEQIKAQLNCVSMDLTEVGPAIGSHVGPGTLGVAACPVIESAA